ncbi:MAG: type II toxin-antitoxin system death-on-curing family toxin [Patescibacteria group bacterium]
MKTLTPKQILLLHEAMIRKHGGSSGIRDKGMFESAIFRPFATFSGADLYPNIYLKCAAFIQSVVKNHPFVDGNKRTAFVGCFMILKLNRIHLKVKNEIAIDFMISVANDNISVDEIALWIKKYSKKLDSKV